MKNIMVCVTQQRTCDRLIKYGKELLGDEPGELFVIHVADGRFSILGSSKEGEALDYLYENAKEYGASLTVLKSDDVLRTLVEQARKNRADIVVLGESREGAASNMVAKLEENLTEGTRLLVIPA
ncbi:MAG: universal stress protein [Clostridiales Family XIII bacterium]|jgi:K+-sensing histidine kinase KdpD|nr:universal stress protein [Clostridiales Family XIII bacterium]